VYVCLLLLLLHEAVAAASLAPAAPALDVARHVTRQVKRNHLQQPAAAAAGQLSANKSIKPAH
jgi:hypothetical protein